MRDFLQDLASFAAVGALVWFAAVLLDKAHALNMLGGF